MRRTPTDFSARHSRRIYPLSWPIDRARTELLYGEWLRRARRKHDARVHLRTALDAFERIGGRLWADRARRELKAGGDSAERSSATSGVETLTPQELQIARLAAIGATNREIAAQRFLSSKRSDTISTAPSPNSASPHAPS